MEFYLDHSLGFSIARLKEKNILVSEVIQSLSQIIGIKIDKTLDGIFEFYYDFSFRGQQLTLHWDDCIGIEIYPRTGRKANEEENAVVLEIADIINQNGKNGYRSPVEKK